MIKLSTVNDTNDVKDIYYYHGDHLGSGKIITDKKGNIYEYYLNLPFGETMLEQQTNRYYKNRYKFTGKELDERTGLYDFGARHYNPSWSVWLSVDPMAGERSWLSPYNYVQNNPIVRVNPDGMLDVDDWVEKKDGTIYWDKNATSQATTKEGERYLGKAVVVFEGSENEKLGNGDNLFGEGANLAKATVYGADDIKEYGAYTMSSDPSKFGTVADGDYMVNRLPNDVKQGPYNSPWVLESRSAKIPETNGYNPAHPDRNPGYLGGVFIHRPNNDGWAGTYEKNGKTHGVSEGCLLIAPNQWQVFENQLQSVNSFHLKLIR